MIFNIVNIQGQWTNGTVGGEGNFCFAAQGNFMDSSSLAVVTPVIIGQLDPNGNLWDGKTLASGVNLLASDNFAPGDLAWHVLVRVKGFPDIDVGQVSVTFGTGAVQGLYGVLEANGWVAQSV